MYDLNTDTIYGDMAYKQVWQDLPSNSLARRCLVSCFKGFSFVVFIVVVLVLNGWLVFLRAPGTNVRL